METSKTKRKLVFSPIKFKTMNSEFDVEDGIRGIATKYSIHEYIFRIYLKTVSL